MNDEFDEKEVTVSAPKRLKYAFIRQLHSELEPGLQDDQKVFELINNNSLKLLHVKTEKRDFMPKSALSLSEFNAIRSYYSGADFERNSTMPLSVIVTGSLLWFVQRAFTKLKWRI